MTQTYFEFLLQDLTNGNDESSNNGNYILRAQFHSPVPGTYLYREVWSYHGDLEPYPEWEELTYVEFVKKAIECEQRESEIIREQEEADMLAEYNAYKHFGDPEYWY